MIKPGIIIRQLKYSHPSDLALR